MPDLYRVTFAFSGQRQGWSESYVFPADNTTPAELFSTTVLPIAQARANLLAREYVLDAARVAKFRLSNGTPVRRAVKLFTPDLGPQIQTANNAGEQPRACLVVQASGTDGQGTKHVFMRGIPDEIAVDGGSINPNGAGGFGSRFASWRSLMLAAGVGWLEDQILAGPVPLEGYDFLLNGSVQVGLQYELFDPEMVQSIQTVRIAGVNGRSRINGEHRVYVDQVEVFTLTKPLALFPYSAGGEATLYNSLKPFQAASDWGMGMIRTRDTGRPSYATRGRQSAQARG